MSIRPNTVTKRLGKKYDTMMGRCYREADPSFKNYGAKGIRVCADWIKDIRKFREWYLGQLEQHGWVEKFLAAPQDYQLDRIDPKGHYTPENCRIVSPQENSRNTASRKKRPVVSAEGETILI